MRRGDCGVLKMRTAKEVRGQPPEVRVKARQSRSKAIFDDLERWLHAQLTRISGKSPLAGAIRYALNWIGNTPIYRGLHW